MFGINWKAPSVLVLLVMLSILLAACGGRTKSASEPAPVESSQSQPTEAADDLGDDSEASEEDHAAEGDAAASDDHDEADEEHEDMAKMHGIPPEAAAVENPVVADEASMARGAELFQTNCTVCHGDTGAGDGPAAAGLEPKPANFSDGHVQENTDGSLFYVISEGAAGTAMPSWSTNISEEDRWHLVNFLRTLSATE